MSFPLRWLSEVEMRSLGVPVYPEGILDLVLSDLVMAIDALVAP